MNTFDAFFQPKEFPLPRCGVKHFSAGVGWYMWTVWPGENVIWLQVARPDVPENCGLNTKFGRPRLGQAQQGSARPQVLRERGCQSIADSIREIAVANARSQFGADAMNAEEAIRELLADELGYEPSEATVREVLKQVRGEKEDER